MPEPISEEQLTRIRSVLDALGVVPPGVVYALLDEVKRLGTVLDRHTEYQCPQCFRWAPWTDGTAVHFGDGADEFWCQTCGIESPLTACSQRLVVDGLKAERDEAQAEVKRLGDALALAEADGDSARRQLTSAYTILCQVPPGRPATLIAAAEKAVKMIRDHDAERARILAERDAARAVRDPWATARTEDSVPAVEPLLQDEEFDDMRDLPDGGPAEPTPLTDYYDAVLRALLDAGIGIRDCVCDENGPEIRIDLAPVSAVRHPVMTWEPRAGWRVAMTLRGQIRKATIRWVGVDIVPTPGAVASVIRRWTTAPDHLLTVEPTYPPVTREELDRMLSRAAR